jgi:hypothetical protein
MENMINPLAMGQHLRLEPTLNWKVEGKPESSHPVILTASIQSGPTPPISQSWATTVAHQMDQQVAITLYEKLGALIRSMGWLQP